MFQGVWVPVAHGIPTYLLVQNVLLPRWIGRTTLMLAWAWMTSDICRAAYVPTTAPFVSRRVCRICSIDVIDASGRRNHNMIPSNVRVPRK